MPRAKKIEDNSDVAPVKRVTRARAPKNETDQAVKPRRAPRVKKTEVVPDVPEVQEEEVVVEVSKRRAPTPIAAAHQERRRFGKMVVAVGVICVLFLVSGVLIGLSDDGPIDVVAAVNERNEKIAKGEVRDGDNTVTQSVPVQNTDNRPNGGLIPSENQPAPVVPTEVATTTDTTATSSATSTPPTDTASTTDTTTDAPAPSDTPVTNE